MTRIIAGTARGRRISVPQGRETRPTADRVREGLFSTLESLVGGLDRLDVLDLYAGSGAVGLEAISRGAASALLVEANAGAAQLISTNARALGFSAAAEVRAIRVEQLLRRAAPGRGYDIVFADPPYAVRDEDLRVVLADAQEHGWMVADAVVAVERPSRGAPWIWPPAIAAQRFRRYGEATLWYGRAAGPTASDELGPEPSEE